VTSSVSSSKCSDSISSKSRPCNSEFFFSTWSSGSRISAAERTQFRNPNSTLYVYLLDVSVSTPKNK
jgi:hypothetical protein